jgi:hypothetical protein
MAINDPFLGTGQMFRDLGTAYKARHGRDRQAPLDASNLRSAQQTYDMNQVAMGEVQRKLGAASDFRDFTKSQPAGMAPLARATGQSDFLAQQGDVSGASAALELGGEREDVTDRVRSSEKARQAEGYLDAVSKGGLDAGDSFNLMNGRSQEQVAESRGRTKLIPGPNGGVLIDMGEAGYMLSSYGADGKMKVERISKAKKAGAGVTWSKPYTVDMDGKKVRLQRSSTGQERQVSAGSSSASEGSFDSEGNLTLNTGQIYTKEQIRNGGETYYKTGKVPSVGRKNSALRSAFVQAGLEVAMENEQSGFSVAGSWAETKAQGSSLSKQKANVDFATAFIDNIDKQIGKANTRLKEIQKNFPRLANIPIRLWDEKVTGVAQRNMVRMWIKEISSETARLSQGNPQSIAEMSASAVESWDKIHDLDLPLKELIDLLGETKVSGRLRQTSLQDQYNRTLKEAGSAPTSFAERSPISKGSMYQGKKVLRVGRDGDKQFVLLEGVDEPVEVK